MTTLLEVRDLAKHFSGVAALSGVTFDVNEAEILAILGPNGSGKTTLFNVLSGFLKPTSGSINFHGQEVGGLPPRKLVRKGLSRSFQQSMFCASFTVRENLQLAPQEGRTKEQKVNTDHLLEICGLTGVADLPSGSLPYGLQRKLGVAAALSTGPDLVLLDEPAAGLSEVDAVELADVIQSLPAQGVSVACIDHNLPFLLPIADRVIVLDAGQKIFEGSPSETRRSPAVIEAYLGYSEDE